MKQLNAVRKLFLITALLACSQLVYASATVIRLATTTSTENSGLLTEILPEFERTTNNKVHVIAVGTGKALRLLREGDVDVVLVHARAAEDKLVADGFGINRKDVMYNDFVIVGDPSDPAKIQGTSDATQALKHIAQQHALFVSRGDDSGTHKKEKQLWREAQVIPDGKWYREAGQGMGKVLQIAGELGAYTLTDRGTWLAFQKNSPLKIMVQGDGRLFNPYGTIANNPEKYPDANYTGAMQLINWITSKS
ncbi:substrate-binding domain-containing protein, partial [Kaarinaea lacus]